MSSANSYLIYRFTHSSFSWLVPPQPIINTLVPSIVKNLEISLIFGGQMQKRRNGHGKSRFWPCHPPATFQLLGVLPFPLCSSVMKESATPGFEKTCRSLIVYPILYMYGRVLAHVDWMTLLEMAVSGHTDFCCAAQFAD